MRRLPEVVVRDFVPAELPEDPTSFTTVIRVDDHRGEVTSVVELLERVAGVQIRRFGGDGQPAEISIRGSTAAQVVVQLDGVTLNSAQSGGVDLSTIPLSACSNASKCRAAVARCRAAATRSAAWSTS